MTKREQLYYLLKAYDRGEYDIKTFCDELTLILYYQSSAINELEGYEKEIFEALGNVAERYSPYVEDRKGNKWFCDEEEVKKAIKEATKKLFT